MSGPLGCEPLGGTLVGRTHESCERKRRQPRHIPVSGSPFHLPPLVRNSSAGSHYGVGSKAGTFTVGDRPRLLALDSGLSVLGSRFWALGSGLLALDSRFWSLSSGLWPLFSILDTRYVRPVCLSGDLDRISLLACDIYYQIVSVCLQEQRTCRAVFGGVL